MRNQSIQANKTNLNEMVEFKRFEAPSELYFPLEMQKSKQS